MLAVVDDGLCTGCGLCSELCPEVFEMQDYLAVTPAGPVPGKAEAACPKAVARCPFDAIEITE